MARITTDSGYYANIAAALRDMGGSEEAYTPEQMADGIYAVCGRQFEAGKAAACTTVSGSFTPSQDTGALSLNIPAGVKILEIIPTGTPSTATGTSRLPVHYVYASSVFRDHNPGFAGQGTMVQYYYNSRVYTSYYAFNNEDGFTTEFATGLVFEAGMSYQWTAYYW